MDDLRPQEQMPESTLPSNNPVDPMDVIAKMSAEEFEKKFPELYSRIAVRVQKHVGFDPKKPGFLLEIDDPFAEGVLALYRQLSGQTGLRLPFVLPYKDKHAGRVIKNYLVRAQGGCDKVRAAAAEKALEKVPAET